MDVGDFIVQIPPSLLLLTCGSGVLLVVMWAVIIWRRTQRQSTRRVEPPPDLASLGGAAGETAATGTASSAAAAPEGVPVEDNVLSKAFKAVRNFFFYTEEEKSQQGRQQARSDSPLAPEANAPPDTVEVMRLWRDVVDGTLVIQIGGQHFRSMPEIREAGQERRFMAILRDLARIAKELPLTSPSPEAEPSGAAPLEALAATEPAPAPDRAGSDTEPLAEASAAQPGQPTMPQTGGPAVKTTPGAPPAPPPPPLNASARAQMAEAEPIGSFFDNVRKAIRSGGKTATSEGTLGPASIADQIEELLQYKLSLTPAFQGRNIHVRQGLGGGVLIQVGETYYEGVREIAEEDVREFVIGVIQEWEERQ